MTAIAGVLCQEGLVIGADSSATFGVGSLKTIEQPTEKISIVKSSVIVACSGAVGLAQRFTHVVATSYDKKKFSGHYLDVGRHLSQEAIEDFARTQVQQGQLGALVGFGMGDKGPYLCEFGNSDFQPEFKDRKLWFTSLGSGMSITDPFLALMREVFWEKEQPTLQDGIFGVTWAIQHACDVNPGGIKGPVHIAVLERKAESRGKFGAYLLSDDDLREHYNNIEEAKGVLRQFKESQKPDNGGTVDLPEVEGEECPQL